MDTYSILAINHSAFPFKGEIRGSFNIFPARLLGLSFSEYLRFCRDILGAKVIGKNRIYPVPYFRSTPEVQQFLKLLNKRAEYALFEHDHPYDLSVTLKGDIVKT